VKKKRGSMMKIMINSSMDEWNEWMNSWKLTKISC
jgi:hypothetical protein